MRPTVELCLTDPNWKEMAVALVPSDFDFISDLVMKRSAIVLEREKGYLVESRLIPLAKREGFASIAELVQKLRAAPANGLRDRVVEAMTTNETSFFRDMNPFEAFRKIVLPEMFKRRVGERRLSIWCGASSTGQEPYTLAMIIKEHFATHSDWRVNFLATDLSTEVLERAREGRYSQLEVNRGLPATLLVKYFQRVGMEWQVKDEIRKMVEFRKQNLIDPTWSVPPADIIFLRNVLIYFDVPTKKQIFQKIRNLLRSDGFLFLGGAETTINIDDSFERIAFERSGCYQLRKT